VGKKPENLMLMRPQLSISSTPDPVLKRRTHQDLALFFAYFVLLACKIHSGIAAARLRTSCVT